MAVLPLLRLTVLLLRRDGHLRVVAVPAVDGGQRAGAARAVNDTDADGAIVPAAQVAEQVAPPAEALATASPRTTIRLSRRANRW